MDAQKTPIPSSNYPVKELLDDFGYTAGTNRTTTLADGELEAFLHGDRVNKFALDLHVVARHNHLGALGQMNHTSDVGGAEVELRTITVKERSMAAAFFLGQNVNLTLELSVRSNATRLAKNLTAYYFFALDATQQSADVVASLSFVEQLTEHLNAGAGGLLRFANTQNLEFIAYMQNAALDTTRYNHDQGWS